MERLGPKRKLDIVMAYRDGHITEEGVYLLFGMSTPELKQWDAREQKYGYKGLLVSNGKRVRE